MTYKVDDIRQIDDLENRTTGPGDDARKPVLAMYLYSDGSGAVYTKSGEHKVTSISLGYDPIGGGLADRPACPAGTCPLHDGGDWICVPC